ncbi:MAG: tetratricopeptide repeat protein [Phycisphaerales bacterium]|nr:tetratricopeptide repeat protein [Phycisphaerales bacterium]
MKRPLASIAAVLGLSMGLVLGAGLTRTSTAAPSSPAEGPKAPARDPSAGDFADGRAALNAKDWPAAQKAFERANRAKPNDPDILNMLAFSMRKNGRLQDARNTYFRALELRENFPQAREYLAECYLELALEQYTILQQAGKPGEEHVATLRAAFAAAADRAKGVNPAPAPDRKW